MFQAHNLLTLALSGALLASACSASLKDPAPSDTRRDQASKRMENSVKDTGPSINQRFASLDEYLAYLRKFEAPADGPWYKEVKPGVFELQTGNLHLDVPSGQKRVFTREELKMKFGFSK